MARKKEVKIRAHEKFRGMLYELKSIHMDKSFVDLTEMIADNKDLFIDKDERKRKKDGFNFFKI